MYNNWWVPQQFDCNGYLDQQNLYLYEEHSNNSPYKNCDQFERVPTVYPCVQQNPPVPAIGCYPVNPVQSPAQVAPGFHGAHQQVAPMVPNVVFNRPPFGVQVHGFGNASNFGGPIAPAPPSYYVEPESYAPCQGPRPWNYAYCYGYYGQPACQFSDVVDIEDFMSNEKRKEKSRDAARCRRSRETEIFTELAHVLPVKQEDVEQLDKASVMRLSIAFLKVREMLKLFPKASELPVESKKEESEEENEQKPFDLWNSSVNINLLSQALDGFLMMLSGDGDVTYVSENIIDFLGISQIDILGQQIWEYSHQCDHDELKEALNVRKNETKRDDNKKDSFVTVHRDFFVRLKCTLTSRGRSVNIKSASFKVIHVTGHMVVNSEGDRILIAVGRPLPHPSNIEIPLGSTTFLTKHSLDMKFTYVDDKMLSTLGYEPEDLLGKSLYDCHHAGDSESLMTTFKSVLSKGQGETCRYRFLGKFGGYCWIVTQATMVYDKQKPQSVVCVNYVISNLESNNEVYSYAQLNAKQTRKEDEIISNPSKEDKQQDNQQQEILQKSEIIEEKPPVLQIIKIDNNFDNIKNNKNSPITSGAPPTPPLKCESINTLKKQETSRCRESSLSPIRRTLNDCSISSISSTKQSPPVIINRATDKHPKSVTASVFTQVRVPDRNILLNSIFNNSPITTATNSPSTIIPLTPGNFNSVSRAQSVTASVFTPISALPNFGGNRASLCGNSGSSATIGGKNINNVNKTFATQKTQRSDMNKGFLSFSDDKTDFAMLKEEPDDLTHLAPTAGDTCIPLDDSTPLFEEMLENLILPDSYGTLLNDDINSLDSQQSNCNNSKNQIDPFINYREESSDTNSSPHLLSPGGASKSPEASSIPSLCSPNSLSQEDEFAIMTMNVHDDIDLTMRAPYIPMNEQEDLPLLTDDLMWSTFSEELKEIKEALQMEAIKNGNGMNVAGVGVVGGLTGSCTSSPGTGEDSNSESSLAALLCGSANIQQQQQQQQHAHHQQDQSLSDCCSSESNKKRKFEQSGTGDTHLVESIETFGQTFSKNSTNDCWTTMNDFLQLNSAQNSPSLNPKNNQQHNQSYHHENIRPEKQNIIIHRAIPASVQVPFAVQSNNTNNSKISPINGNICRSNSSNTINMTNSSNKSSHDDVTSKKYITKILSITPPPNTGLNKLNSSQLTTTLIVGNDNAMICNNKRHLTVATSLDSKRVKNSSSVEIQTSPQLLQQLMAPTPQKQKLIKSPFDKSQQGTRWSQDGGGGGGLQHTSSGTSTTGSTPSSNSVLKNLLVSGCDDPFASRSPDIIMIDDSSRDSMQDQQMSPGSYYGRPLYCKTSTAQVLRNYGSVGSNPMIGGAGILPSPPIPTPSGDDSLPPGLISLNDSDSGSDSGIECGSQPTFATKSITRPSTVLTNSSICRGPGGHMDVDVVKTGPPKSLMSGGTRIGNGTEKPPPLEQDKMTYPFLDDSNPLCSPFLFDLCSDDYAMEEPIGGDILQDNDITKVLDEWTVEMT